MLYEMDRLDAAEPPAAGASLIREDELDRGYQGLQDAEHVLARIEIKSGRAPAARKRLEAFLLDIQSSGFPREGHIETTRELLQLASGGRFDRPDTNSCDKPRHQSVSAPEHGLGYQRPARVLSSDR